MVNKLIANIYNLSSDERNGAVSRVRGGSMGKTNGQIFRGLYHGYYPHLCGMHNKKNIKKGTWMSWSNITNGRVQFLAMYTHICIIYIYTHTPYIVRIQRFTATIFMHVCTKNYRSCYTHISTPSLLYACAIRLWKTFAVERQEIKSVRVLWSCSYPRVYAPKDVEHPWFPFRKASTNGWFSWFSTWFSKMKLYLGGWGVPN
jgi:hypothetical protein